MGVGTYNYTFKSVVFQSVKVKSVKIKKSSEALEWSKKSLARRFENNNFESVFFKSIEIESVVVSAHPQGHKINHLLCLYTIMSRHPGYKYLFVIVSYFIILHRNYRIGWHRVSMGRCKRGGYSAFKTNNLSKVHKFRNEL